MTLPLHRMRGMEAPALPEPFVGMVPSGMEVRWRMPDPYTLVSFNGPIPDPITASVIDLLEAEKSYTSENDPRRHRTKAQNIVGVYALAAAMLEWPKLDPTVEYGDGDTLGRREVGYQDVIQLYQWFRFQTRIPISTPSRANEPERTEDAPSDSDGVPPDTSTADGGN